MQGIFAVLSSLTSESEKKSFKQKFINYCDFLNISKVKINVNRWNFGFLGHLKVKKKEGISSKEKKASVIKETKKKLRFYYRKND